MTADQGRYSSLPARTVPLMRRPIARNPATGTRGQIRQPRAPRKQTGFSQAVKLQARSRAGGGDPDQARCEATGVWLGRYGGEIQHRVARGMGGTSDPAKNTIVNAVLLSVPAHRLAESRDRRMNESGFWLRNGQDPALTPILLHSEHGSGITVWLTDAGTYAFEAPAVAS